ncbi:MAG: helix-turn-helix domain-containing protein [Candidatus Levybacteria bacterium]|nr:helix-turn-helix domain-containing protein [Candidatus Levybacteria bacterium]
MIRVGQKLYEERVKKGLTLDEVSKATKIKVSFLSAIEKGEYQKLPSRAYAHGFLRNYTEFLGLPKKETLALFRREFDEDQVFKVLPEGLANPSDFPVNRFKSWQNIFYIVIISLILLGYILFQYRFAILNPQLQIYSPKEKQIVVSQEVEISGKTDPNTTILVDSITIPVDQNGNFKKKIDLFSGKTVITIKAINRFGRQTTVDRQVEVK